MHLLRDGGSREQSQGGGQDVYIYICIYQKIGGVFFLSSAFLPKNIFNDWSNLETYPILEYIIYK